jgi:hypothetical protein
MDVREPVCRSNVLGMHDRDLPERGNEAGWFRVPRVEAG